MKKVPNRRGKREAQMLPATPAKGQDVRSPWASKASEHASHIVNMELVNGYWRTRGQMVEATELELPQNLQDGFNLNGYVRVSATWYGDWFCAFCVPSSGTITNGVMVAIKNDGEVQVAYNKPNPAGSATYLFEVPYPTLGSAYQAQLEVIGDKILLRQMGQGTDTDVYFQLSKRGGDWHWHWWPLAWEAPRVYKYLRNGAAGGNFHKWAFAWELARVDDFGMLAATTPRVEMSGGTRNNTGLVPSSTAATIMPVIELSDAGGTQAVSICIEPSDWTAMFLSTNVGWNRLRLWRTARLSNEGTPDLDIPGSLADWQLCAEWDRFAPGLGIDADGVVTGTEILSGTSRSSVFTYSELDQGDRSPVTGALAPVNVSAPNINLRSLPDVKSCAVVNGSVYSCHYPNTTLRDDDAITTSDFLGFYPFRFNASDYVRVQSAVQGPITAVCEHKGSLYAFKRASSFILPLGDLSLPFRTLDEGVGVARSDKLMRHPLGIFAVCSDDTLRVLRDETWRDTLASATLGNGIPVDVHSYESVTQDRTWWGHNSYQVTLRTMTSLGVNNYYAEHAINISSYGGLHENLYGELVGIGPFGVCDNSSPDGNLWWGNTKVWKRSHNAGQEINEFPTTSAVEWRFKTIAFGDQSRGRHYDARSLISKQTSAITSTALFYSPSDRAASPDVDPEITNPVGEGTTWELTSAGGDPLNIVPGSDLNVSRQVRYSPVVGSISDPFSRMRVYATTLWAELLGTGPLALHALELECYVSEGGNYDDGQRASQIDWSGLTLAQGEILPVGIHDLETEPWTWS